MPDLNKGPLEGPFFMRDAKTSVEFIEGRLSLDGVSGGPLCLIVSWSGRMTGGLYYIACIPASLVIVPGRFSTGTVVASLVSLSRPADCWSAWVRRPGIGMRAFAPKLFAASAGILSGNPPGKKSRHREPAYRFLQDLGYLNPDGTTDSGDQSELHLRMLQVAQKLDLFLLDVPDAPGLIFVGGRVLPDRFTGLEAFSASSAGGLSSCLAQAFESCVGESIEYLSQLDQAFAAPPARHADNKESGNHAGTSDPDSHNAFHPAGIGECRWLKGTSLKTGKAVRVPAGLCLRQPGERGTTGMSTGCAAAPTPELAIERGLYELIERDAASLWWEGGASPKPIPLEILAEAGIESLYRSAGRVSDFRSTIVLDITTDTGIPSVAAVSTDRSTGDRFACGLASRSTLAEAVHRALFEMLQMELGQYLLKARLDSAGDQALNAHDRMLLKRNHHWRALRDSPLLQPTGPPRDHAPAAAADSALDSLLARLAVRKLNPIAVSLTREWIGVPVVKTFLFGLQKYPGSVITPRLNTMIGVTGGTQDYTGGVPLL